jgi:hypothetical protein
VAYAQERDFFHRKVLVSSYRMLGAGTRTNQGFAFIGTSTIRVLFQHIVSFEPYKDGIGFETDRVRNNKYLFRNLPARAAPFIDDAINVLNGGDSRLIAALNAQPTTNETKLRFS